MHEQLVLVALIIGLITGILGIIGTGIAIIRWCSNLESKNARLDERLKMLESDSKELRSRLDDHMMNGAIHFSIETSKQVEEKQNQRFKHIESQLTTISSSLEDVKKTLANK